MAEDKFILIGLGDENSKNIAEVLSSKTSKKILDFLGDIKEASEKDIADGLGSPINTIEYNLKKLEKAGFIKKSPKFFWSVKGRKIPLYKLSNKHIIISPTRKPNLNYIKTLLPILFIALAIFILATIINNPQENQSQLNKFNSYSDLSKFLKENQESSIFESFSNEAQLGRAGFDSSLEPTMGTSAESAIQSTTKDYSQTNIQVSGVDESDIVKTDGKYIYKSSGNKITITKAYPAEEMEIISKIELEKSIIGLYLNKDKLIILTQSYGESFIEGEVSSSSAVSPEERSITECLGCSSSQQTIINIYDITEKSNPTLEQTFGLEGNYINSRMIENQLYLISNKYINTQNPELPRYSLNNEEKEITAPEIYYFEYPDNNYVFTTILSIDINNNDLKKQTYLTGGTNTIYVSQNNIYLTYEKRITYENYMEDYTKEIAEELIDKKEILKITNSDKESYEKLVLIQDLIFEKSALLTRNEKAEFDEKLLELTEKFEIKIQKQTEKTIIHKINIKDKEINYQTAGEVPGRILNQFSMDEYENTFRIATTTGNTWQDTSLNHVYLLDKDLEIISSIEDIAKGERIYSARFMGSKLYLVTFKQTDPFFVIDLSDTQEPKILGYLKIPGYSSYLHPLDENHIIGIGSENNNLKISIFDVTDFENPQETNKYHLDETYSYSPALHEHKAFLFDFEKELMVIPIQYSNLDKNRTKNTYWQGAYVFNINPTTLSLRGKINHNENEENQWEHSIERTLYIKDILYTISNSLIKASNLNTLEEINKVEFEFEYPIYSYTKDLTSPAILETTMN